ncbi:MAG: ATP-dependent Clp protease ATP-binding subunit ClpX, partial [Selenomonas sp.]|nr:ATP-dependent Clp protease ATP-binding subunit ClpX [Selenomonas sp.]
MATQSVKHQCSFCKRTIEVRNQYDMPIYDPSTGFAICSNCIREINHFLDEHAAAQQQDEKQVFAGQLDDILAKNKPHIIKQYLDEY